MSARKWKPGDVAMVTYSRGGTTRPMLRGTNGRWWEPSGYFRDQFVRDARPLVVIDPEDREQVERLVKVYNNGEVEDEWTTAMQAALHSLVAPPKPKPLLDRLKERAPDGMIDPALAEQIVKEWLIDSAEAEAGDDA